MINNLDAKSILKTSWNAASLGAMGYASIHTIDNTLKMAITAVNNSKFAWYTKLAFIQPIPIGAFESGLTCAMVVLVDTVTRKIFDYFKIDTDKNKQLMTLRNIVSIGLTGTLSTTLGLTSSLATATAIILASMAINALMLSIFSKCQEAWYES